AATVAVISPAWRTREALHGSPGQIPSRRVRDATPVVQRDPGPARSPATAAAPGHRAAGRPRRLGAAVPHGADRPGSVARSIYRHSGGGHRRLPAVAAPSPGPPPAAG